MRHDPVVKKLDDGNHHVCCGECSEAIGITATVKTIVASSASRRWANQLADLHRRRTTT